ncbi:MAG: hypothetical protein Q8L72_12535 [Moraxellaceae bacterium]|nr:hypothetical protein [Moraxellaceae bacterium]
MLIRVQKHQWLLILLALFAPLLLNVVAIWQDVGTASILKIWQGTYPQPLFGFLGGAFNPLPEIFLKLLLFLVVLGLLAWFMVFISSMVFFQKQSQIAKLFEIGVMALLAAVIFFIVSGFMMPLIWLPKFHDYLLGFPSSPFTVNWSRWFIFPVTAIILFSAMFLSRDKNLEKKK